MVKFSYAHLTPGIQFHAPWAVRSWEYRSVPDHLKHNDTAGFTLKQWFEKNRVKAHDIVKRYFRFQPHIEEKARALIPPGTQCLAIHIRHSDKAGKNRQRIKEMMFQPYAEEYVKKGGGKIFLATDSTRVLWRVKSTARWSFVRDRLVFAENATRSQFRKPVFRMEDHHQTNTEALVDILAMSQCQFFLHGFSGLSEAVHYLNINLHNRSVDLEDPQHMNPSAFGQLVKKELLKTNRTSSTPQ